MSDYAREYGRALRYARRKPLSEEAAFHKSIHAAGEKSVPDDGYNADALPGLVYADWLDEHDRPGTAAMFRLHHASYVEHQGRTARFDNQNTALAPFELAEVKGAGHVRPVVTRYGKKRGLLGLWLRMPSLASKTHHLSLQAFAPAAEAAGLLSSLHREGVTVDRNALGVAHHEFPDDVPEYL